MMSCTEVLSSLDAFMDAELDDSSRADLRAHLESCESCRAAYDESTLLKRLVQRKTIQPPIPGGLVARIERDLRGSELESRAANRFGTAVTALAAALLVFIVGWLLVRTVNPPAPPLAHAAVLRELASQFDAGRSGGVAIEDGSEAATLRLIADRTGVALEHFPKIPQARLVSWTSERILGRACVRLDYSDESPDADALDGRVKISIFAISDAERALPGSSLHFCDCIAVRGATIYCLRQADTSLNLFTTLGREVMDRRVREIY